MSVTSLSSQDDLQIRVAKLERAQRRWQAFAISLGAIALLAGLLGAVDLPRKLDLEELTLRDSKGNARLRMFLLNDHPHMVMLDADGIPRSQFSAEMIAMHERGKPRITLTSAGKPKIILYKDDGKPGQIIESK